MVIITELYAYVAILLVILTYGMETGLFRFSAAQDDQKRFLCNNSVHGCYCTSSLFAICVILFNKDIAHWIGYKGNSDFIIFLGLTLSLDAICSIVFAKLRIENKVRRFATIKIINVIATVIFGIFFPGIFASFILLSRKAILYASYMQHIDVGYVFIANLLASFIVLADHVKRTSRIV